MDDILTLDHKYIYIVLRGEFSATYKLIVENKAKDDYDIENDRNKTFMK